jgi:hypothetical protein
LRDFYTDYALENGPEKAFKHLAKVMREKNDVIAGCHYISHGIGHAYLRLHNNNFQETFDLFDSSELFKNVATCGNGFYHGIVEEFTKNAKNSTELIKLLKGKCEKVKSSGNCFHGIGHAAMIHTNYNTEESIKVCNEVSINKYTRFTCHTGAFMEYAQADPYVVELKDGKIKFEYCDKLEEIYRPACYLEQSSAYETFSSNIKDYKINIGYCKEILDPTLRMACIKLFAIRAVRIIRYEDMLGMCGNTTSKEERAMCKAIMSDRIVGSIDKTRISKEFKNKASLLCFDKDPRVFLSCINLIFFNRNALFEVTNNDVNFPSFWNVFFKYFRYRILTW